MILKQNDMMKKWMFALAALGITMLCSSCRMKSCYCYHYTDQGVEEVHTYTAAKVSCNSLSTGDGQPGTRLCVEPEERLDPNSMAPEL